MKMQQGNQVFAAAAAAVALLTASAAFAETPVRSPLFVAGKTWNGGYAGPTSVTPGGKAVATRSFQAPANDGFAGPVAPSAGVAVQVSGADTQSEVAGTVRYADHSAARSYAN
jgi:hypothetical protein